MESNENSRLSSYYHLQQPPPPLPPQTTTTATATVTTPTNGIAPNAINTNNSGGHTSACVYSHAVPSAVSTPLETVKRKRGRPRKYGKPEQAAAASKRLASSASSLPKKKDQAFASSGYSGVSSSKKSQLAAFATAGQSFTPHVFTVDDGQDVAQKILLLMQQSKREICILSASGSVSSASLLQSATAGGNVSYEGRFDILKLSGSYVSTELGGRTGGLSVCLSSSNRRIIGGGVGGPLIAAGPVQVVIGSFVNDPKKDDASSSQMQSPGDGTSISGMSFRSPVASPCQNIGGGQYMVHPQGAHATPPQSMEWRENIGHGVQQPPDNGDYNHIQD